MKKIMLVLFSSTIIANVEAQLYISSGATLNIQSNAIVTVQGDVVSSADITGPGKLILSGTVASQNLNMNGFTIPNLEIDNLFNPVLTGNTKIGSSLLFTNGKIRQDNFDLSLSSTATITNGDAARYLVTNGTGRLIKEGLTTSSFTYPIGNSITTYNPVTISNSGIADNIGVRCLANVLNAGPIGTAFSKEVADASWDISETIAGGSTLSLTSTWSATDELAGFNRTKTGISYYIPTPGATLGWDLLNSQVGAAIGTNPYSITRTGISSMGVFAVGTRPVLSPLLVTPKVFLQGPYNVGTGLMGDNLRTLNLIPTTEPYTGMTGFTHAVTGSGGGETSTAAVVGSVAAAGNDAIVDWVFVQLHDGVTGAVVGTTSALVQRDGDLVDTDGVSPVNMAGFPAGTYYVSVRHRNHLGARSNNNFALAKTTTTNYNFTADLAQSFAGTVANPALATLNTSIFGLYAGDASGNKVVRYSGPGNDNNQLLNVTLGGAVGTILNSQYSRSDLNMNGNVRYSGPANDNNILLNIVLGGLVGAIINQPTF